MKEAVALVNVDLLRVDENTKNRWFSMIFTPHENETYDEDFLKKLARIELIVKKIDLTSYYLRLFAWSTTGGQSSWSFPMISFTKEYYMIAIAIKEIFERNQDPAITIIDDFSFKDFANVVYLNHLYEEETFTKEQSNAVFKEFFQNVCIDDACKVIENKDLPLRDHQKELPESYYNDK